MKRLIILPLMTVLVLAFAAAACGASGEDSGEFATSDQFGLEPGPYYAGARARLARQVVETVVVEKPVSRSARLTDPDVVERKIVTNVDMNVRVDDVNGAMELVTDLVDTSGGFVVSVSRTEDEFESFAFMSFRVPSNNLEVTLSRVRDISERVERENRSSQDVTTEFVDIEARLGNLRAAEQQLMVLFERSGKVSDVLEVQRELTNMRGQIESLQGRLNYLSQTTATSLVSVWFRPTSSPAPISDPGWSPSETARGATRGLAAFGRWFADVAITVAIFSPVWVPIVVIVLGVVLWDQRRQRKNTEQAKLAAQSQPDPGADNDQSMPDQAAQQEKQE
jgi:hypothetical protein